MEMTELNNVDDILQLFEFRKVIMLIIGIGIIMGSVRFITRGANVLSRKFPARRLAILQIVTIVGFIIYIAGTVILIQSVLQPPKELLLALGGSAAVAIGFSLKDLVSSLIAGLILLFDRPFQVGDRVLFGDIYGEIKSIGLRAVRLVTLDDSLVTIPNSKFITDAVSSGNSGALDMMICIDFHISVDADIRLARKLLYETAVTSRFAYLDKPVAIVMTEVGGAERPSIQLKVKAYVIDVQFEKAFQTDIVLRGNEVLRKQGIQRPPLIVHHQAI